MDNRVLGRRLAFLAISGLIQGWISFIAMLIWWNFLVDGEQFFSVVFGLVSYFAATRFWDAIVAAGEQLDRAGYGRLR